MGYNSALMCVSEAPTTVYSLFISHLNYSGLDPLYIELLARNCAVLSISISEQTKRACEDEIGCGQIPLLHWLAQHRCRRAPITGVAASIPLTN